jgi:hypothetical protein
VEAVLLGGDGQPLGSIADAAVDLRTGHIRHYLVSRSDPRLPGSSRWRLVPDRIVDQQPGRVFSALRGLDDLPLARASVRQEFLRRSRRWRDQMGEETARRAGWRSPPGTSGRSGKRGPDAPTGGRGRRTPPSRTRTPAPTTTGSTRSGTGMRVPSQGPPARSAGRPIAIAAARTTIPGSEGPWPPGTDTGSTVVFAAPWWPPPRTRCPRR